MLCCLYFKDHYKIIAIDLSKQLALDGDPKAIQRIKFTRNSNQGGGATMFFTIEETKENILDFSQGTMKVLRI